jgi:hypothetical protein
MPFWGLGREEEKAVPRHLPLPTGPYAVGYQVGTTVRYITNHTLLTSTGFRFTNIEFPVFFLHKEWALSN